MSTLEVMAALKVQSFNFLFFAHFIKFIDFFKHTANKLNFIVWDISRPNETTKTELTKIDCGIGDNYVRSCKLLPDNNTLLVGGESPYVCVIDLTVSCL